MAHHLFEDRERVVRQERLPRAERDGSHRGARVSQRRTQGRQVERAHPSECSESVLTTPGCEGFERTQAMSCARIPLEDEADPEFH